MTNSTLFLIFAAGLMNGSFIVPARFIKNTSNEKKWFYYSLVGLGIMPWLILFIVEPNSLHFYKSLPPQFFLLLLISGAIFGLGQICFAYAISYIGIALSFSINLGLGVTIGSLFVVLQDSNLFSRDGFFVSLAILLVLSSLLIYFYSGKYNKTAPSSQNNYYGRGWLLACFTGLTCGLQNIAYVITAFHSGLGLESAQSNSYWVWPPFLNAGALVIALGFFYQISKTQEPLMLKNTKIATLSLTALMGLLFAGSLAIYSFSMSLLHGREHIIGWPVFVISIILASQIWGWLFGELKNLSTKNKLIRFGGALLLFCAIPLLTAIL